MTEIGVCVVEVFSLGQRNRQPPPYEALKDRIEAFVMRKAQTELVTQLRETAKVERLDKPAAPATPAMPAPAEKK